MDVLQYITIIEKFQTNQLNVNIIILYFVIEKEVAFIFNTMIEFNLITGYVKHTKIGKLCASLILALICFILANIEPKIVYIAYIFMLYPIYIAILILWFMILNLKYTIKTLK